MLLLDAECNECDRDLRGCAQFLLHGLDLHKRLESLEYS